MTGDRSRLMNFMKKFIGTVAISVEDMMKSSPICLLSKASKHKSWLWHRRLNHLNFGTINDLARKDLVRGLPRLKFEKDHLCFACQLGKSKKHTHKPKTENTNLEVLNTLHMDLCGPMRVQTINGKKYILSSRLLRYAKSRSNGKLIYNSIMNGPYVRRMILEPGDVDREVPVPETFHELKQMEADDQAIQTILLGLPEDIYAAVDSCVTAQEIWLRVQQMMKGSDIGIQEKKAKLFNEWERFTSTDGESIESYYHRFSKLMNDFKRNKHFPEKIASNLKFLNNLQPEWSWYVLKYTYLLPLKTS
ncbi:integrase, catalytic region, zinc finger, CCHC-type containing protein [Tanacetum coccineum]